jgi:hypothetical protein
MSHTPEELRAIEKDISNGVTSIVDMLTGIHKALPLAIGQMNPHATVTRKMLGAMNKLYEAGVEMQNVKNWLQANGVPLKKEIKE